MDLKYLWIKKFRNIKEQGFSFTDKYIISYNSISKELSIAANENALPDGFYASNIISLTGILGENGAGKSNVIDYILTRIASVGNGAVSVYEEESVFVAILGNTIFKHAEIDVVNQQAVEYLGFTVVEFDEDLLRLNKTGNTNWDIRKELFSTKYLFYASNFERPGIIGIPHLIDISTSYKINRSAIVRDDFPAGFYNEEIKEQIELLQFIKNGRTVELPFDIPTKLHVTVEKVDDVIRKIDLTEGFLETVVLKDLKYILNNAKSFYSKDQTPQLTPLEEFMTLLNLNVLLTNIKHHPDYYKGVDPKTFHELLYLKLTNKENISNSLVEVYGILLEIRNILFDLNQKNSLTIEEEEESDRYEQRVYRAMTFTINSDTKESFYRFMRLYTELSNGVDFIKRYWMGLSSGQQAYLNIYSRLFEAYLRIQAKETDDDTFFEAKHCTVIIDEGETFYHPQWQKQFVKKVTDFVSMLFAGREVQLIFASNSPFIASDIPTSNLVFIKRSDDGKCEVEKKVRQENTFAANIHTLLTDSFFLQGGLMGDFAKQKVNELIEYLNTPYKDPKRKLDREQAARTKADMKKLIQLIGEPVIRHKMEVMWSDKFGLEEEVELLKKRLEEAQKKLDKKNG